MISKIKEKIILISSKDLLKTMYTYSKGYRLKIVYLTILRTISSLSTIAIALITKNIIDAAISKDLHNVKLLGAAVILGLILKLVLSKYTSVFSKKVREFMHNDLQFSVISSYYSNKWLFINSFKTGDLITRATNDVSQIIDTLLSTFPSLFSLVVQLGTAFVILSSYDQLIAFVAFILGPTTIIISWALGHKLKLLQSEIQESVSNLRSHITESVQNIELIKTFNIENNSLDSLKEYQKTKRILIYKKAIYKALATGIIDLGYTLGFLGAILLGAYKLYNGVISFGTFTAFSQLVTHIQNPMYGITKTIPSLITVLSSVERISEFNTTMPIVTNSHPTMNIKSVEFKNVSFAYNERNTVIQNLNFTINKGEKIGLRGPSGEGKTTIIRLLLSLVEPSEGNIYLHYEDGTTKELESSSINNFSYVPQRNSLFSGSILHNLQLAKPDATSDEIKLALETAQIYDFIMTLKDGLHTIVGERLGGLSEGQAQRICIARAVLHDTPFLILDEATSALDAETERRIVEAIKQNYSNKALVAVTHREKIFSICNTVYALNNFELIKEKNPAS